MYIASWNLKWINSYETTEKSKDRIKNNQKRSSIAKDLLGAESKIDVLALLEAGNSYAPEIDGYIKMFRNRKLDAGPMYQNGILLYAKEHLKAEVNKKVLDEFDKNKTGCFLPITIEEEGKKYNILFVWATIKRGENGGEDPYGYNRFTDILATDNFPETKKFLNGEKNNVVVIGDFNITIENKKYWNKFLELMKLHTLKWVENKEPTFITKIAKRTNDHCFVSERLYKSFGIDVKDKETPGACHQHINLF